MTRNVKEEVKLSFFKRLTGRQDPSSQRIIASFLVGVLIFVITFYVGFYLNKWATKAEANVVFYPFIEDSSFLPIQINNGPKALHSVRLKVKTCYMDNYEEHTVPDLIAGQDYPIHLTDEDTILRWTKYSKVKVLCAIQKMYQEVSSAISNSTLLMASYTYQSRNANDIVVAFVLTK